MVSHVDPRSTVALKICVFLLAGIYCYTLVEFNQLAIFDLAALSLTFVGTLLTLKAKLDLGKYHTWTGYHFNKTKLVVGGIYAYIRHPIYTGVHIFFFGTIATMISHAPFFLSSIMLTALVYVTSFLVIAASRETDFLAQEFGVMFLEYKNQVHPFLPLRKYGDLRVSAEKQNDGLGMHLNKT